MLLELGYILLFIVLWFIILYYYNQAMKHSGIEKSKRNKNVSIVLIVAIFWFVYVQILIFLRIPEDYSLPPKLPMLVVIPLFLFSFVLLYKFRNHKIIHNIPKHIPIAYQSFRIIIEVLFYFTFLKEILPVVVTFEGFNYDVIIGILAPIFAYLAYKKKVSNKVLIAWNIFGLLVIGFAIFTFISSFYFPSIWGGMVDASRMSDFFYYPYILLPAFFMPSVIFVHLLSIIQFTRD